MEEPLTLFKNQVNDIDTKMLTVKNFLDNQDYHNAKFVLEEIISINPDHLDANYILSQLYEFEEEFTKSARCLEKIVHKQSPPELKYKLAQLYENADEYNKAFILFKECYQYNPQDINICEKIAHVSRILGNNNVAIEFYNRLLKNDPDNIVALTQLMELYEDNNNFFYYLTKARINELEELPTQAISCYKKALAEAEKTEDAIQIRYILANIYTKNEKYLQAVDEYLAILNYDVKNFKIYKNLAEIYCQLDNFEAACDAYEKALEIYPDDLDVAEELSDIYLELGAYKKAETLLNKILKIKPDKFCFYVSLAKVYTALNMDYEAKKNLFFVLKNDSKNVEAIGALIDFYILRKDYQGALRYLQEMQKLIPKSPFSYRKAGEVYEALGKSFESHYNFGIYHDLKGEKQLAIDEFTWALEAEPANLEIILKIANLYEEISEIYIAVDYYQKAYAVDNGNILALQKMGEIYISKKDYQQAIEIYKEMLKFNSEDKNIYLKLGNAYEQIKNNDKALETYKKYLTQFPNSSKSDEIRSKIENLENKIYGDEDEGILNKVFRIFSKK
ncbi:MAG: tetratricopeptide repeat protein [bacterium]